MQRYWIGIEAPAVAPPNQPHFRRNTRRIVLKKGRKLIHTHPQLTEILSLSLRDNSKITHLQANQLAAEHVVSVCFRPTARRKATSERLTIIRRALFQTSSLVGRHTHRWNNAPALPLAHLIMLTEPVHRNSWYSAIEKNPGLIGDQTMNEFTIFWIRGYLPIFPF